MEHESSKAIISSKNNTLQIKPTKEDTQEVSDELECRAEYFLLEEPEQEHEDRDIPNTATRSVEEEEVRLLWLNICRICANFSDYLIPIFYGEGAEHELHNKIQKYLPIDITQDDNLPLQLCYHCATTLLAWHELSEGCLKAERRLLDMHPILSEKEQIYKGVEDKNESATKEPEDIERSCDGRTPFKTLLDVLNGFWMKYKKRCLLQEKRQIINGNCDSVWIGVPDSPLEQTSIVSDHFQSSYQNEKQECLAIYEKNDAGDFMGKQGDVHTVVNNEKEVKKKKLKMKNRLSSVQNSSNIMKCIKDQKSSIEVQQSYQCSECGKRFKLKDSYLRHMRIHKDERPFTCHVCGKQFRDSGGLSRHLKDVHAKLKNFTCDICCKSFASKATRDDHRRTHTGERPYICDSCGKTFKSKASLYIHSKLHTDEFPHPCSYCSKKFRRRQEMLAHITTHTGEKNYECDICSKRFRVKSELVRHKLVHSENKPFVCVNCGLAFRQKRYLNNHVKSRHIEILPPS